MKKLITLSLVFLNFQILLNAQMVVGRDSLYGNEWIDYAKTYYRLPISSDGIYRLTSAALQSAGIPLSTVAGNQFQMIRLGQEIPIFTTTNGLFGANDFIEFNGRMNRGEIDQFMYPRGKSDMLNPEVSVINDTIFYYLTWSNTPSTKRIATQASNIANAPAKESFFWYNETLLGNEKAIHFDIGQGVQLPEFNMGEGFAFDFSRDRTVTLKPSFIVAGQNATLRLRWVGDRESHQTMVRLNGTQLFEDRSIYNPTLGYTIRDTTINLTANQVTPTMNIQMQGLNDQADYNALAWVTVRYARQFRVENGVRYFEFEMPATATPQYIEFENFNYDGADPFLFDATHNWRMITDLNTANGVTRFLLPPSATTRKLILYSRSAVKTPALRRANFVDLRKDGGDYIFISHQRFLNDGSGRNVVQEYADYRKSPEGGSYKPILVDIEQLYDQFAYGIANHPLSIRNFAFYIKKHWSNPRHILLIGKSREYHVARSGAYFFKDIVVPTMGYPGCDMMFVMTEHNHVPIMSVGRLPTRTPEEVRLYLQKVKDFEAELKNAPQTIAHRDWTKQIMHLSSGGQEGPAIKDYMLNFERIAENSKMGANVTTFYKTNLDPVQTALNDRIFALFKSGVVLTTFYGHSAATSLDFDINNPDVLTNKTKYPLFLALGCSAANCHQGETNNVGEIMILYKDKGLSVFTGTTGTSFLNALNQYASEFYRKFSNTHYGQTLGDITKATFAAFDSAAYAQTSLRSVLQEYQIIGDPAMRFSVAPSADYTPDATTVKIEPAIISAQVDSFSVSFEIVNLGTIDNDSINILIRQQLPNGKMVDILKRRIPTPQYREKFSWFVPMPKEGTAGQNRLHISVDADNEIVELPAAAEMNNDLLLSTGEKGVPFLVLDNNVKPTYPTEFAIVGKKPITLKASTADPLAKEQNYIIELDTTALFNSPLRQRQTIKQKGGVLKWQPTTDWKNNTVYYWRTSVDSVGRNGYAWETSSFLYLEGVSDGWNQSHYFQYTKNQFETAILNSSSRKIDFINDEVSVDVRYLPEDPYTTRPRFFINNNQWGINPGFPQSGVRIVVFDSVATNRWTRNTHLTNYGLPGTGAHVFRLDDASELTGRKGLIDFINQIPTNNYFFLFTILQDPNANIQADKWGADSVSFGTNLYRVLEQQGAKIVRNLNTPNGLRHYAAAFKKDKGLLAEKIGGFEEGAPISFNMTHRWYKGTETSRIIGPAKEWQNLEVNFNEENTMPPSDSLFFRVIGINSSTQAETVLLPSVKATNTSLRDIDAKKYPFLKLQFFIYDSLRRTAPQLNHWRVYYKGYPDLAVNPNLVYSFSNDTLQQGENLSLNVAIENISDIDADSVLVKWSIRDEANKEVNSLTKYAPLSKNGNFTSSFNKATKDLKGKHQLLLEVNPDLAQPELHTFNNFLQTKFSVETDKRNPLLNVTFDGIKIMNNDIVSPKPYIIVELRDENKYLALADTGLFKLFIQPPSPAARRPIYFNDPAVKFNPATSTANGQNKASIEYRPIFKTDGTYQLIVSGRDVAGNTSGDMDYSVAFQIITKSAISNVLNYPNPFSTKTQFVYTLTGETPPSYFKIQIMSVSGKVVREITQDEIGALRIGTHRTEYSWDGTDEYGNKLANGVYLYRIIAKGTDGKAFENYDNGTADYFKKGIGKLVIMR
jgi:hypothetical protein